MNSDVTDSRRNAFGSMRLNRSFGRLFAPSLFHARHSACPRTVAHGQLSNHTPVGRVEHTRWAPRGMRAAWPLARTSNRVYSVDRVTECEP